MADRIIHSGDAPMGFKDLVADESEYGPKVYLPAISPMRPT